MTLSINNLAIGYKSIFLDKISVQLSYGDIAIVYGKNGSGKTTFIKTLLKEIETKKGNILLNETDLKNISAKELSKLIAVVFTNNELQHSISVLDLVTLGRFPYRIWYEKLNEKDNELIENALRITNLSAIRNTKYEELSDGYKQIVMIARALVQNTPILILDEPFSHLDIENQLNIIEILKNLAKYQNKIIIFTSHEWNLSFSLANKIILMKESVVSTGFLEDVLANSNFLTHSNVGNYSFDFSQNKFLHNSDKRSKSVKILKENFPLEKMYWLKSALEKNEIENIENSKLLLSYENNQYIMKYNKVEIQCNTIEKLVAEIIKCYI